MINKNDKDRPIINGKRGKRGFPEFNCKLEFK